jgi:hypothetical protein
MMWALMRPIEEINRFITPNRHPPCQKAATTIGNYLFLLDKAGLSPWKSQYETDPFESIMHRARMVGNEEAGNEVYQFEFCNKRICSCSAVTTRPHLAKKLRELVEDAHRWKLWVCLDCTKTDWESYRLGNCRVEHWS